MTDVKFGNILSHYKAVLLAAVGPFGIYFALMGLKTTFFERAPTVIQIDRFKEDYHGQLWVQIDGRLLPEYEDWAPAGKDKICVFVPLVSAAWKKGDAVHVVCILEMPRSNLGSWKDETADSPNYSLTGLDQGSNDSLLRNVKLEEPVVWVRQGETPRPAAFGLFVLFIMGFFTLIGWGTVLRILLTNEPF
jgi:hypothetical protein